MIGTTLSHYKIVSEIGRGGMGIVYKAQDTKLSRTVAIKLMPGAETASETNRVRFQREAQAAAQLNHPNVATIHEIDEENGRPFIVMEYIEGDTLQDRIEKGPLGVEESISVAFQVADALHAAHAKGIVHRDVKAGNVMFSSRDRAKVLDFGLAKLVESADVTQEGSTVGTVGYMSPEQVRGEKVTWASDAWSLGVLIYEMIVGERPFDGAYNAAITYQILSEDAPTLLEKHPGVPQELSELIAILLSKDATGRGASLDHALEVLSGLGGGAVTRSSGSGTAVAAAGGVEQRKFWLSPAMMIGAAAVVVIAVVAMLVRTGGEGQPAEIAGPELRDGIAVLPFTVRGDTTLNYLGEGIVSMLSSKIDGVGGLRSVDDYSLIRYVDQENMSNVDPSDGVRVATRFGAHEFILGGITRVGNSIRFSASRYDEGGSRLAGFEITADSEDGILDAVDQLARNLIAERLGDSGSQLESMAALASASFPALREQLKGEAAMRVGDFQNAYTHFKQATDIDSTFAMAWYRLGTAAGWGSNPREAILPAYRNALRLGSNLPERINKKIQAANFFETGDIDRAAQLYVELTKSYPDDAFAWFNYGDLLYHYNFGRLRPSEEAKDAFLKAHELDPGNSEVVTHLFHLAAEDRDFDLYDELLPLYLETLSNPAAITAWKLLPGLASDSSEVRQATIEAARDSGAVVLSNLGHYAESFFEDFKSSEELYRLANLQAQNTGQRNGTAYRLANALYSGGKPNAAWERLRILDQTMGTGFTNQFSFFRTYANVGPDVLEELDSSWRADDADTSWSAPTNFRGVFTGRAGAMMAFKSGILAVQRNDEARVQEVLSLLRRRAPDRSTDSLLYSLGQRLEAEVAFRKGRYEDAAKLFSAADLDPTWIFASYPLFNMVPERIRLAESYVALGRDRDAQRILEALGDGLWNSGVHTFQMTAYVGPVFLMRAQIYDRLGRTDDAITYYTRFLETWWDPEPELQPQVDEVRARLDELVLQQAREPGS